MKHTHYLIALITLVFLNIASPSPLRADTLYVSIAGGDNPAGSATVPYNSWATAATDIQSAVDQATPGDTIILDNDHFLTPAEISVSTNITIRGNTGNPNDVVVNGRGDHRVFHLGNSACVIESLTITNGYFPDTGSYNTDNGGGVYCTGTTPVLTNCVISGNTADDYGGGAYYGTLNNCTISGNTAGYDGGGAYWGTLNNCTISGNTAGYGGGAFGGTLNNCTISGNTAGYAGGGARSCTLNNCTISGNTAKNGGGASGGTLNNCTISGNSANGEYSYGGGAYDSTLNNCTISGNTAHSRDGGGAFGSTLNNCTISGNTAGRDGGGAYYGTLNNCIVWENTASMSNNYYGSTLRYSCSYPLPAGEGNISNNPQFVSVSDFHLESWSPCINAGTNAYAPLPWDIEGTYRIHEGTVDMGAYEFLPEPGIAAFIALFILAACKRRVR